MNEEHMYTRQIEDDDPGSLVGDEVDYDLGPDETDEEGNGKS